MERALKKELTAETRRKDLILGTLSSIQKYGYEASTIQTICEESGFSRGLVSHYFEGKEDLLIAAFEYLTVQADLEAKAAVEAAGADRFRRLLAAGLSGFDHEPAYPEVWLHFWSVALSNAKARQLRISLWSGFRESLQRMMAGAAEERGLTIDVKHAALLLSQLIDGLFIGWVLERSYDLKTCRHIVRTWLCDLFGEDPDKYPDRRRSRPSGSKA